MTNITSKIAPRAKRGQDLTIKTALVKIDGRLMLIGYANSMLCYAGFGESYDHLRSCYPHAIVLMEDADVKAHAHILECAWKNDDLTSLTFYVEGTAFQISVWQMLLNLRKKQHYTYQQIATMLGRPKSARAVGNAVGANPISVFIPCHRVQHAGGKNTGYMWGVGQKEELLQREVA